MPRPEKVELVEELREKFSSYQAIFLTDFTGLKVEEMNRLRSRIKQLGGEYRVLKNTLARRALEGTPCQEMERFFVGPVAAAFAGEDPVAVAKELLAFSREYPNLRFKGGFLQGKVLEPAQVREVANLPSREVLLARLVGSLKSPIYQLVGVLSGPYRKLVYALSAVAEKREAA
jgi:large subunit ribosomal protein L10